MRLNTTAFGTKETLDHKDLQTSHRDDSRTGQECEPKDSAFGRVNSCRVTVLSSTEILLCTLNICQRSSNTHHRFFHLCQRLGFLFTVSTFDKLGALLILQGNLEINQLLGPCRHTIRETKGIFTKLISCKHVVGLLFLFTVQNGLTIRSSHVKINIK